MGDDVSIPVVASSASTKGLNVNTLTLPAFILSAGQALVVWATSQDATDATLTGVTFDGNSLVAGESVPAAEFVGRATRFDADDQTGTGDIVATWPTNQTRCCLIAAAVDADLTDLLDADASEEDANTATPRITLPTIDPNTLMLTCAAMLQTDTGAHTAFNGTIVESINQNAFRTTVIQTSVAVPAATIAGVDSSAGAGTEDTMLIASSYNEAPSEIFVAERAQVASLTADRAQVSSLTSERGQVQ